MATETAVNTTWAIDPSHSEVNFKVKHLVISTVTGAFHTFEGTVHTESEDFDGATASFSIDVDSVSTNSADRDGHLKSGDFFDAENHPKIVFENGKLSKSGDDYTLAGDLTIRGVTKPVTLDVEFGGIAKDPWGNTKAGFEITGKIARKDWGLNWNTPLEAGGMLVGEEVKLSLNVQLGQQG